MSQHDVEPTRRTAGSFELQYTELDEARSDEKTCPVWVTVASWLLAAGLLVAVIILAMAPAASPGTQPPSTPSPSPSPSPRSGLSDDSAEKILSFLRSDADPCDDFYEFACGGFIAQAMTTHGPNATVRPTSVMKQNQNQEFTRIIQEENYPLLTTFFRGCEGDPRAETLSESVSADLAAIQAAEDLGGLFGVVGELQLRGMLGSFFLDPIVHSTGANRTYELMITTVFPKVAIPASITNRTEAAQDLFANYIGYEPQAAAEVAEAVLQFHEDSFSMLAPVFGGQQTAISTEELNDLTNHTFEHYFARRLPGLSRPTVQASLPYMSALASWVGSQPLQLLKDSAKLLFFFDHDLSILQLLPAVGEVSFRPAYANRSGFCQALTQSLFPDVLAHVWVAEGYLGVRTDPASPIGTVHTLLDLILESSKTVLLETGLFDDSTRAAALKKLGKIATNVGYNKEWLLMHVPITGSLALADWQAVQQWNHQQELALLGTQEAREGFRPPGSSPTAVNAFYQRTLNRINLCAGMIRPPIFDNDLPLLLNLASYGGIIGHEVFHAFDGEGRQFDGDGFKHNWWSDASLDGFLNATQCLVNQFDSFTVQVDGAALHVKGVQTEAENIADLGGVHVAFGAFGDYYPSDYPALFPEHKAVALTNAQLFFVKYAQTSCAVLSPEDMKKRVLTNEHAPYQFRVNGPLSNFLPFAEAFQCSASSPMGRSKTPDKCTVFGS